MAEDDKWAWLALCPFMVPRSDGLVHVELAAVVATRRFIGHADSELSLGQGNLPRPTLFLNFLYSPFLAKLVLDFPLNPQLHPSFQRNEGWPEPLLVAPCLVPVGPVGILCSTQEPVFRETKAGQQSPELAFF